MRLIRDVTPSGNVRALMANLLDAARYPAAKFGALYHRRWRVEEAFKRIKHRLRLEGPSGLTYLAFQQDFAAKVLADKLCQLLSAEPAPPDTPSRPNRTYAQGALKRILADCLLALEHVRIPLQKPPSTQSNAPAAAPARTKLSPTSTRQIAPPFGM